MRDGVLLLGNSPAICLARSLKGLGYRVVVGLDGGEGGAQYSRFADEAWDHPSLETRVERTDAPDHTGLAVEGRTVPPSPDLAGFTERLTAALSYSGVGLAQFLVDRDTGAVFFIELNPRVAGSHAIAEAAGLQLGHLSIVLASPGTPEIPSPEIPFVVGTPGLRYAWTYGDLRGLAAAVRDGLPRRQALRWAWAMTRAFVRADVHMTWRWDDPVPTLALFARTVPLVHRLLGRIRARPAALNPAPSASR